MKRRFTKHPTKIIASVDMSFSKKAKQLAQSAWNKGMTISKAKNYVFDAMTKDGYSTDFESALNTINNIVVQVYDEQGDPNDPSTWVESCDKVTASTRPHPPIPAGWERIPEGDDDDGNWGTIAKALPNNQGYYWINIIEDEQGRRCFELEVGYRGSDGSIGKIWKVSSRPFYRLSDIVTYADNKWKQLQNEYDEDIDACDKVTASTHRYSAGRIEEDGTEDFYYDTGFDSYDEAFDWGVNHDCTHIYDREKNEFVPINSCDTKYFANMVSASSEDTYRYLIRGFYDSNRKGIAEDAWADTISEVDNIVNEYANKGYYLEVRNLETGTVLEFSADNWFDEIYPDGGFSAIPGAID